MTLVAPPVPNHYARIEDVPIPRVIARDEVALKCWNEIAPRWVRRHWVNRLTLQSLAVLCIQRAEVVHRANDPTEIVEGYGGRLYDVRSIDVHRLEDEADDLEYELTQTG